MVGSVIRASRRVRQVELDRLHRDAGGPQRPGVARDLHGAAVQLAQQLGGVRCEEIHHTLPQGRRGAQARGSPHRLLGPVRVAAPQLRQRAEIGDRVVDRLVAHAGRPLRLAVALRFASQRDGGGGTEVRARGHGSHVRRVEDVGARARRAGTAGRDIGDHRHRRAEDALDDVAHRRVEPARRVELQDDQFRTPFACLLDPVQDVLGRRGTDPALDPQRER